MNCLHQYQATTLANQENPLEVVAASQQEGLEADMISMMEKRKGRESRSTAAVKSMAVA
jgi:hypothetical protein